MLFICNGFYIRSFFIITWATEIMIAVDCCIVIGEFKLFHYHTTRLTLTQLFLKFITDFLFEFYLISRRTGRQVLCQLTRYV